MVILFFSLVICNLSLKKYHSPCPESLQWPWGSLEVEEWATGGSCAWAKVLSCSLCCVAACVLCSVEPDSTRLAAGVTEAPWRALGIAGGPQQPASESALLFGAAESSGPGSCIPSDTSRRLYFALYSVNAPRPAFHFLSHLSLQLGFRLTSRVTAVGVQAAAKHGVSSFGRVNPWASPCSAVSAGTCAHQLCCALVAGVSCTRGGPSSRSPWWTSRRSWGRPSWRRPRGVAEAILDVQVAAAECRTGESRRSAGPG